MQQTGYGFYHPYLQTRLMEGNYLNVKELAIVLSLLLIKITV
jgi:hypothetical protein